MHRYISMGGHCQGEGRRRNIRLVLRHLDFVPPVNCVIVTSLLGVSCLLSIMRELDFIIQKLFFSIKFFIIIYHNFGFNALETLVTSSVTALDDIQRDDVFRYLRFTGLQTSLGPGLGPRTESGLKY